MKILTQTIRYEPRRSGSYLNNPDIRANFLKHLTDLEEGVTPEEEKKLLRSYILRWMKRLEDIETTAQQWINR